MEVWGFLRQAPEAASLRTALFVSGISITTSVRGSPPGGVVKNPGCDAPHLPLIGLSSSDSPKFFILGKKIYKGGPAHEWSPWR